ncbi:hypothetical protein BV25DRAFT_1313731 [Artomyces pyxidatus]|uniref:Uncharacterized protein n=1 Tax=Artomyces pyxidatus TaxID=48021 RepID=A0ACB8SQH9_9AGAM|nr:hypothetical protein BV25DRAFT_1313731 [Artomyces pyxidatus]
MSSFQAFSLQQTPSTSSSQLARKDALSPSTPTPAQTHPTNASPLTTSPSSAIPTVTPQIDISSVISNVRAPRRRVTHVKLSADEEYVASEVSNRVASCLTADQLAVLFPEVDSPFQDAEDVVNRLLPYHIFQIPKEDLGKGKQKVTEEDILKQELAETKFALECFKRRQDLQDRFRRARIKSGKRAAPDDQAYLLAQAVLEGERTETATVTAELRTARAELDRIDREKRVAAMPPRPAYYSTSPATPVYAHHYRTYQYPYAHTPTPMTPASSSSTQGYPYSVPLTPTITQYVPPLSAIPAAATPGSTNTSAFPTTPLTGAIPVQLPVSSLPTLHALGIVPVPASSLSTSSDQPPPPAVLRGASADGSMLSLEINVSLLQAAQMSGLALVLNSIMRNATGSGEANGNGSVTVPPVTPYSQIGAPYTFPYIPPQSLAGPGAAPTPTNATSQANSSTSSG